MNSVKDSIDLMNKMDAIDEENTTKRKKRVEEFQQSKPSPQYFKGKAQRKLECIVKANLDWTKFKECVAATPKELFGDGYKEIEKTLKHMVEDKDCFNAWIDNNITPLSEK